MDKKGFDIDKYLSDYEEKNSSSESPAKEEKPEKEKRVFSKRKTDPKPAGKGQVCRVVFSPEIEKKIDEIRIDFFKKGVFNKLVSRSEALSYIVERYKV